MSHRVTAWSSFVAVLALALAAPTVSVAQEGTTVQGEIVDLACYMAKGSKGPAHKPCAQMCAKKGLPIGLLTQDQGVFLLLADHGDTAAYETAKAMAGDRVEVSGKKISKDGMVSLLVASVKPLGPQAAVDAAHRLAANHVH